MGTERAVVVAKREEQGYLAIKSFETSYLLFSDSLQSIYPPPLQHYQNRTRIWLAKSLAAVGYWRQQRRSRSLLGGGVVCADRGDTIATTLTLAADLRLLIRHLQSRLDCLCDPVSIGAGVGRLANRTSLSHRLGRRCLLQRLCTCY